MSHALLWIVRVIEVTGILAIGALIGLLVTAIHIAAGDDDCN